MQAVVLRKGHDARSLAEPQMSLVKENAGAIAHQPEKKNCIPIGRQCFIAQRIGIGEQDERSMSEGSLDYDVLSILNGDHLPAGC